jgi:hypothetical protein
MLSGLISNLHSPVGAPRLQRDGVDQLGAGKLFSTLTLQYHVLFQWLGYGGPVPLEADLPTLLFSGPFPPNHTPVAHGFSFRSGVEPVNPE